MKTVKRFEDLEIWQKARMLCKIIHSYTQKEEFSKDYKLVSQTKGSSGSVMDNIAEGFERGGNKEFIQFLYISKGSTGEIRSQFYRALDNSFITQEEFDEAYLIAEDIGKMEGGLIKYLIGSEIKGSKYKS